MAKGKPPKRQKKLAGGPPKLSAYNRFVKRFMKGRKGKATANMKAAARAWKSQRQKPKRSKPTSTRAKPKAKRKSPAKKGGTKRMGGFNSQKLMKFIRLFALGSPAIAGVAQHGLTKEAAIAALKGYTGVDARTGQFDGAAALAGWTPYLFSILMTYGIPKVAGMIRTA